MIIIDVFELAESWNIEDDDVASGLFKEVLKGQQNAGNQRIYREKKKLAKLALGHEAATENGTNVKKPATSKPGTSKQTKPAPPATGAQKYKRRRFITDTIDSDKENDD